MAIEKSIKIALVKKELTQAQLAEKVGVSKTTVSGWCKGKVQPTKKHQQKIADTLDYTLTYLISLGVE